MTFKEYQNVALEETAYGSGEKIIYPALGLAGESGEVIDKIKKVLRDNEGIFDSKKRIEIAKEIGDVLWYCTALADDLGYNLELIAMMNLDKIISRRTRNKINGDGDNR